MLKRCSSCGKIFDSELRIFKYIRTQRYYSVCPNCRDNHKRYNDEHKEEIKEKHLETYKIKKQNKVCTVCGCRRVKNNLTVCQKCLKNNATIYSKLYITERKLSVLTVGNKLFRKPNQSMRKVEERYGIILSYPPIVTEIVKEDNIITIKCDEISFYVDLQKQRKTGEFVAYALYVLGEE